MVLWVQSNFKPETSAQDQADDEDNLPIADIWKDPESWRYNIYIIVSILTAITFLHYRVATKMALEIWGVPHVQGWTMMVDEATTWSI